MASDYDSTRDTLEHIRKVQVYLGLFSNDITSRARHHDETKLHEPEKSFFDTYTPLLASLDYGSEEYKQALSDLRPALEHHYQANSHHPEHYPDGVDGMTLADVVEMLCDWKAAGERHNTGSMEQSLEVNARRFGLSPQLANILWNTAFEYGWIADDHLADHDFEVDGE